MTSMSRPISSRHRLEALFTLALAVLLFLSSKSHYQPFEGSHHAGFRDVSQQYDTNLDAKTTIALQELESLVLGSNASLDSTYDETLSQPSYIKREDSSEKQAYDKALCNGNELLEMVNQDLHSRKSEFGSYGQLEQNGWSAGMGRPDMLDDYEDLYKSLKIPAMPKENLNIVVNHVKPFQNRYAKEVKPSRATYRNIYNARRGLIIADILQGPAYELSREGLSQDALERRLPDLRRWSDVTWLVWKDMAGNEAGRLQYVIHHEMTNPTTEMVIRYIAGLKPGKAFTEPYPGIERKFDTDEGKALLGTPNGSGTAWLLYDHRDEIQKRLDLVRVWAIGNIFQELPDVHMLIKLKDP